MVMMLARKNKVEESPHFNEIVERLSAGESGRKVSVWLKNTYNEDISFAALNRYKNKINMPERVEVELNKRAKKRAEKKKKLKNKTAPQVTKITDTIEEKEETINNQVTKITDTIGEKEETINSVAETIANNMEGVARVAAEFPAKFKQACNDAENPGSNVTTKDVARLALDANKLYNDYFKQDNPNVEVNVDSYNLSNDFNTDKMRDILNAKQNRNPGNTE